jgi:crotonobetainyl-CoA:carnitine CoA-transferase CaiB-like acyl-CoA transferase
MGGGLSVSGESDRRPVVPGIPYCDILAGSNLAVDIAASLIKRQKTGRGQKIESSLTEAVIAAQGDMLPRALAGDVPGPAGNRDERVAGPADSYEARDGTFVIACSTDDEFTALVNAMGMPSLAEDPRFRTPEARRASAREGDPLFAIISAWAKDRDVAQIIDLFAKADVPAAKVRDFREITSCPHLSHREMFRHVPFENGVYSTCGARPQNERIPLHHRQGRGLYGSNIQRESSQCGIFPRRTLRCCGKRALSHRRSTT